MRKMLQFWQVRKIWILLGFGIAGLASTICMAAEVGTWVDNPDHIYPKGTSKVCAEWESAGAIQGFCDIDPQYIGTSYFPACNEAFRHHHS